MCSAIVIKMSQCDDTLSQLLNKSAEMEITDMCSDTQCSDRSVMADNGQQSAKIGSGKGKTQVVSNLTILQAFLSMKN